MKWILSPTGVPYVTAGGVMFILNDLSGENKKFSWIVFAADYIEEIRIVPKNGSGRVRIKRFNRRSGSNFPLGREFKLPTAMTKTFNKEEKELIRKVREWVKKKEQRKYPELKFKKR